MCWLSRLLRRRGHTVGERVFVMGVLATSNLVPRPTVVRLDPKSRPGPLVPSRRAQLMLRGRFDSLTRGG